MINNDSTAAWFNFIIKNRSKLLEIFKDKNQIEGNKIWGTLKKKFFSKYNNPKNKKVLIKISNRKLSYDKAPTLFTVINSRILANSVRARSKGKMFSTSCINRAPDQNNSMDEDTKNNIIKDLAKYDKENNKPSFRDPGLPDFASVANRSRSKEEYEDLLDKFKAKPSIKEELREHNEQAQRYMAQKWAAEHPETPTEKVIAVVEKHQKKDYTQRSEDYPGYPKKEAKWNEKVDERAFEHGADLPEQHFMDLAMWDPGIDVTPNTPSVRESPSPSSEGSSQDEDNSSSESSSGYLDENPEHSEGDEGNQDENSEYRQDYDSQNDSNSQGENSDYNSDEPSGYNSDEDADDDNSQDDNPGEDENSDHSDQASPKGDEGSENSTNKRPLSSYGNDNPSKKLDNKQSPLDYVLEKQSTEMPDIMDSDGGD